jgi:hypothetical protein
LIRLIIDCQQMKRNLGKYVRPGAQPANTDIKTYDSGNLFVSTQGQGGTTNCGELHVRYRVRLMKPVLESGGYAPGSTLFISSNTAGESAAATTTAGLLLASATSPVVVTNTLGASIASTGLITLPAGTYLVEGGCTVQDTGAAATVVAALVQSSTLTNFCEQTTVSLTGSGTGYTSHQPNTTALIPFVLNTTAAGSAVIGLAATATYSAGTGVNWGWLRVTAL